MVAGSFQTWKWYVLPVERWTSVTPIREEDVATRLAGLGQVFTKSSFWGNRTVRGGVNFGTVRLALVVRDTQALAWPDTPDNPLLYSAWLVVRGKIQERDGKTEVRLWALPGSSAAVALAIPLGFVISFGYAWFEGLVSVGWVLPPLAVYVLLWKLINDLLASVREHVARAVAAS